VRRAIEAVGGVPPLAPRTVGVFNPRQTAGRSPPFEDGNARAARLWFEYALRRARLPTPPLAPWVLRPKRPGDVEHYGQLVRFAARSVARQSVCGADRERAQDGA